MSYNKNMNSDEYYNFEDNNYINPTMSRDEQLSFVDNLRNIQDKRNTEIETQTHGLGTQIPSKKGGLNAFSTQLNTTGTGGPLLDENGVAKTNPDSFFNKRYQTTQLNNQVSSLKSAAQASALNNILANEQAKWKKRYNDAYKAYQKRKASSSSYSGGTGENIADDLSKLLGIDTNTDDNNTIYPDTETGTKTNSDYSDGKTYYTDASGTKHQTSNLNAGEALTLGYDVGSTTFNTSGNKWPNGSQMTEGSTYKNGKNTYVFTNGTIQKLLN